MTYTIGEAAKLMNLSVSTLRFYDKEGLLPGIEREKSGIRKFKDSDIDTLRIIECLKNTGMQLKDIKVFLNWCKEGEKTFEKRLNMLNEREEAVLNQIEELNKALKLIKYKQWYYETAIEYKSEEKVKNISLEEMPSEIRELYIATR